jgi:hypothetical protein
MSSSVAYMRAFLNYMGLTVLLFGPVGNFLVFKIYSSVAMAKTTISNYFRAQSIVDTLNLINLLLIFMINQFDLDLSQSVNFFCAMQNYFTYINGALMAHGCHLFRSIL